MGLISIPTFWLALALQYGLGGKLGILPLSGPQSQAIQFLHPVSTVTGFPTIDALVTGNFTAFWDHLATHDLPVIALTGMALGGLQRITRASMVETLSDDFIVAKRSYGLSERSILYKHGLRNSLGPIATVLRDHIRVVAGQHVPRGDHLQLAGDGIVPGSGRSGLDYPVVMAVTLVSAVAFLMFNFCADILIALDPRVRQTG